MERIRDFHDYALYKFTFTLHYITLHFQGQKVKGQLAGGAGILWRPPAQLVYSIVVYCIKWAVNANHRSEIGKQYSGEQGRTRPR